MKKFTLIGSVLATITGSIAIALCINPHLFFLDRKIFKKMYEANEAEFYASRGVEGNEKDKDKKEEEFLIKWANESLCPTYNNKIKDKKEKFGDVYQGIFSEIEGHCKPNETLSYDSQNSKRIGLKSIFIGLKDIK